MSKIVYSVEALARLEVLWDASVGSAEAALGEAGAVLGTFDAENVTLARRHVAQHLAGLALKGKDDVIVAGRTPGLCGVWRVGRRRAVALVRVTW